MWRNYPCWYRHHQISQLSSEFPSQYWMFLDHHRPWWKPSRDGLCQWLPDPRLKWTVSKQLHQGKQMTIPDGKKKETFPDVVFLGSGNSCSVFCLYLPDRCGLTTYRIRISWPLVVALQPLLQSLHPEILLQLVSSPQIHLAKASLLHSTLVCIIMVYNSFFPWQIIQIMQWIYFTSSFRLWGQFHSLNWPCRVSKLPRSLPGKLQL